jgi:hypothetical protein
MPNDTADMSSSNNSTSRESTVAMPIPSGSNEATAQASAQASGVASNAFGIRDNQGVVPLSLPPEGTFESWEAVKKAANAHAGLELSWLCSRRRKRGTEGSRQEISLEKIPDLQARRVALSRQNSPKRGAEETQNRMSKKTGCEVRLRVQDPDGS